MVKVIRKMTVSKKISIYNILFTIQERKVENEKRIFSESKIIGDLTEILYNKTLIVLYYYRGHSSFRIFDNSTNLSGESDEELNLIRGLFP
jgi:hypothetical protein